MCPVGFRSRSSNGKRHQRRRSKLVASGHVIVVICRKDGGRCQTYQLNGITSGIVPIMLVSDYLCPRESVRIHEAAESQPDLSLLRRRDLACWVTGIAVFRLVL